MKTQKTLTLLLFVLFPLLVNGQKIDREKLLHDLQYLSSDDMEGRQPFSEGYKKAQQFIQAQFDSLELSSQFPDYMQYFSFKSRSGEQVDSTANIIGFIPGSKSEKIIVITAHYDHMGKDGDHIFNGADDNASGTAALLALAAYFSHHRPIHSMIFAALDAEEMGLQGAKALVKDFPFPLEQVILNVNMDMISRNDKQEIYATGTHHYPQLAPILEKAAKNSSVSLILGHDKPGSGHDDWTYASDHAAFHAEKIPFVYFGVEDHEDYHKPTDTFDKIDPEFYQKTVHLILDCIVALDREIE